MSWQAQYQSREHAQFYANKRDGTFLLRLSNYFEQRMILKALKRIKRNTLFRSALDCASGTGRMLPVLAKFDVAVLALDTSAEMLEEGGRFHALFRTPPRGMVGSAVQLPLTDRCVDIVLCSRLIHHFPDAESRIRILREFARVARVGVVVSFFDRGSYRGWRRTRRKRKPHRDHGRFAISRRQFQNEAESAGLEVLGLNALLRFHTEVTAAAMLVRPSRSGALDGLRALGLSSAQALLNFKPRSVVALSGSSDTFRVDCEPTPDGPSQVYVKRYRYRGWGPVLRGLFRGTYFGKSRAQLEFEFLTEMRRRGVAAVKPLQWIEDRRKGFLRSAALITEGVPDAPSVDVYWPRQRDLWSQDRQICFVETLAQSVARLHEAGVQHGGLYARNILVTESGDEWLFTLLDPSRRCRLFPGSAPFAARVSDLSDLAASGAALNWQAIGEPFLRAYCGSQASKQDFAALGRAVRKRTEGKTDQEDHRVAVGTVLSWLRRRMEQSAGPRLVFDSLDGFFEMLRRAELGAAIGRPVGIRFQFDAPLGAGSASDRAVFGDGNGAHSRSSKGPVACARGSDAVGGRGATTCLVALTSQGITVSEGAGGIADLTIHTDAEAWLAVINAAPEAVELIRGGRVQLEGDVRPLGLLAQWLDKQPLPASDKAVA